VKYRSCSSINTDAYRAGFEVGSTLKSEQPEVILVFLSINYADDFTGLFEGLYDGLDSLKPIVFGCTGDGIYEKENAHHHGVSALAITSGGSVRWAVATSKGVRADSYAAARGCASEALSALGGKADFAFVLADGIQADGSLLVSGFRSILTIPFVGGLAADDRKFGQSFLLVNGEAVEDSAAILLGRGPVKYRMNAASGWMPIGAKGVIEKCTGSMIEQISGMSAYSFMYAQLGKSPSEADLVTVPLATTEEGAGDYPALRSVIHFNPAVGTVTLSGSIQKGSAVQVCLATRNEILNGVDDAIRVVTGPISFPRPPWWSVAPGASGCLGIEANRKWRRSRQCWGASCP